MIRFWFEFASAYSYLAAMRVEEQAKFWEVPVAWQPFLLGPIFARQGWDDSPYNLNLARGRYMWRDLERQAQTYGLAFRKPSQFPRNSVLAARVACFGVKAAWLPKYARAIYRANWEQDQDIADRGVVAEALRAAGQDPDAVLAAALAPESKGKLREATERAWGLGIFGAPTFECAGELFWGNDRMEQAFAWYGRLPVACDLSALEAPEQARRAELAERLRAGMVEVRELPDGLALRVPKTVMPHADIEELMALEVRCCPFLSFAAHANGADVEVQITGCADVQAFLKQQFVG